MLKEYERPPLPDKPELKENMQALSDLIALLQQDMKAKKLPVLVLVEGWGAAGKGSLIGRMFKRLDPRFFRVVSMENPTPDNLRRPFLYRYMREIPEAGKFVFYDSGWMEELVTRQLSGEFTPQEYAGRVAGVRRFERTLRDNGYLVVKIFLHISKKEQGARMKRLLDLRDTEWRVSPHDLWQHKRYDDFFMAYDDFMEKTDARDAHWHIMDGTSRTGAEYELLKILTHEIEDALKKKLAPDGAPRPEDFEVLPLAPLSEIPLDKTIGRAAYKSHLKVLQRRLSALHNAVYRRRIPVVICYEGWDAAGKGGNIKRVADALDPRGYEVVPVAAPEPHEIARHYLWRFWTRLPKSGHIAIFDRTWYGRVMVERVEGFCPEEAWRRAYGEINAFERELTNWGAVVLKFWLQIDKDTQLARFTDRQNTPEKQWKITDEDWRNRDKWDQYEAAVGEMLKKTNTAYAPWHVIPSVDKHYARLKTLEIIVAALEDALKRPIV